MPDTSKTQRGNYEILSPLGVGAGGTVDTARCLSDSVPGLKTGDMVAIKTLRETGYKSFQQEVEILRRLDHPNIVRYRDSFEWRRPGLDEESYCIVTELLEGKTLKELMVANPGGLSWDAAKKIMEGTLDALLYSTGKRVLHRDLKSSNIYVTHDHMAKVIDFGIARAHDTGRSTVAGGFKGTFDYMAPDFVTFQGEDGFHGDEQSDIFSFGVIFYEVVTGTLPTEKLKGSNIEIEFVSRWLKNPPKVKFLHPVFDILVGARSCLRKCLEVDRAIRYKSFRELQADFANIRPRRLTHHDDVYEYVNYLGKGGFGKVFHARRVADGRDVAIKEMTAPDKQTRRFEREARILKELPHPRLVAYLDFVEVKEQALGDTRRFFLILEYLKGMPATGLSSRIKGTQSGMDPQEVLSLFIGYLEGLEVLHEKGIIHRDIKPGNLYAPEGEPENAKIFDLGIAHDNEGTRTHGQVPGTLDYMPPEFAGQEGGRGSAQSDIYSLGVTLYQALTRQLPFDRLPSEESAAWAAFYMRAEKPQPCSLDHPIFGKHPALVEAMRKCLANEPAKRYASAREMRNHLATILKQMSVRELTHEGEVYEIGARIGQGSTGATYLGQRRSDGLAVVIKELAAESSQMDRVETEAGILHSHPHSNLVNYIAFVEAEETEGEARGFQVLEFLKGLPAAGLRERINRSPMGLKLAESLALFDSYLACLEHLHGKRIFHRDIKPAKLYAPEGGFEMAKIFGLGVALGRRDRPTMEPKPGTLAYKAPELVVEGARFSQQADIFSLAVTLYETVTGRSPFPQASGRPPRPEDCDRVSYDHPVFETATGRKLAEVLSRAMSRDPRHRHASATELRQALASLPPPPTDDTEIIRADDYETAPPFLTLEVKVVEQLPKGKVRAGLKQLWVLEVTGNLPGDLKATAATLTPELVAPDGVQAKVEGGKIKVAAQTLKSGGGQARIEVTVGSGTSETKTDLLFEIEAAPAPALEVKVAEQLPRGAVRAGRKQMWLLDLAGTQPGELTIKATTQTPALVPQDGVQAKFEDGKIKVAAQTLESAVGAARIALVVRNGGLESKVDLTFDIEAIPGVPLELKVAEQVPDGPVRAGRKKFWVLDVAGKQGNDLSAKVTTLSPALVTQEGVQSKAEDGRIKVAAQTLEAAKGPARISVVVRSGTGEGKIELGFEIEPVPPLVLKVAEQIPGGPVRAGRKQFWVLDVSGNESGDLSVKAISLSTGLVPQDRVQAKVEDGKIKVAAQSLDAAKGPVRIGVTVNCGKVEGKIELGFEIEPTPPLVLKVAEQLPSGPLRAGRKRQWVLNVSGNESGDLSVKGVSLSTGLVPQDRVQAKVEDGKIKVEAQSLETAKGPARISVAVRCGTSEGKIELGFEIEPIPPLILKVTEQVPGGPVRAGRKQSWVLEVSGIESGELTVKAVSLSPFLVPQAGIQAKIEDGKIKVTAQTSETAKGPAKIGISVRCGSAEGKTELKLEIEGIPPIVMKISEQIPNGPVRAGRKQLWVLDVSGNETAEISVKATSLSPALVPQDRVQAKVEGGKIKVAAQALKTAGGPAKIKIAATSGASSGETELTLEVEPIPPPTVELLTPQPLRLNPKEDSLQLEFVVSDAEGPADKVNFYFKLTPPDLVSFEAPPKTGAPNRTLLLSRAASHKGTGGIEVTVEAEGRSATRLYELKVERPPRSPVPWIAGIVVLAMLGAGAFFYMRPSLSIGVPVLNKTAGEEAVWLVNYRNLHGKIKAESANKDLLPQESLTVAPAGDGAVRVTAAIPKGAGSGTAQVRVSMDGTDLTQNAVLNIAALRHLIEIVTAAPAKSPAGKQLVWEIRFTPPEDADKVQAASATPAILPQSDVTVEKTGDGTVRVKATPPKSKSGLAQINVTSEGTGSSEKLEAQIQPLATHVGLLSSPDSLRLAPSQDSAQLSFSLKDDDLPPDALKFHISVEPAGLVRFNAPPVTGGTERMVTYSRAATFGKGKVTVEVDAGERSVSTNYDLDVSPNPIVLTLPPGQIEMRPTDKVLSFTLGIYDPYTPAEDVQPTVTAEPGGIVRVGTAHLGTNWTIQLTRSVPGDATGTLAIRLEGKGGALSTNIPFTLEARPKPTLTIVGDSHLHVPLAKLNDPPLRIACHVSGSGTLNWRRKDSSNPSLVPPDGISYEAPQAPGGEGYIRVSPVRGTRGEARLDLDVSAEGALETNVVIQLDVEGDPTSPEMEINPMQVSLGEGGHTNLTFAIKSDYFEPGQLTFFHTIEPPGYADLAGLAGGLTTNFSLDLNALRPGQTEIKFILRDPNGRSAGRSVTARVLQGFHIIGPTNMPLTAGSAKIELTFLDEKDALRQMGDPEIVSSSGFLSSKNWTVATTRSDGSNVVDITITSPGQIAGKDTLTISATDIMQRKASHSVDIAFVQPLISRLPGIQLVWVPNLPGTGFAIWKPPGGGALFQGGGWVAVDKVTQEEYVQLMPSNPSTHRINPNRPSLKNLPVETMTYRQAMNFCDELTKMDSAGGLLPSDWRYTLPTVEQWAFYAAGTPANSQYAYFDGKDNVTIPVHTLSPNASFGLYDVLGDVYELTRTPKSLEDHAGHVRRGGWCQSTSLELSTDPERFENSWWLPDDPGDDPNKGPQTGFRIILVPANAAE